MAQTLHANTQGQTRGFARVAIRAPGLDAERRRRLIREFRSRLLTEYPAAPDWLIGGALGIAPRTVRHYRRLIRRRCEIEGDE